MAPLTGYTLTQAGRRRVDEAVRTWRRLVIVCLVVLALIAAAALVSVGAVYSLANKQGQQAKDASGQTEEEATADYADTFTWAVGCQEDSDANQCSSSDVSTADKDLSIMAAHVTLTAPGQSDTTLNEDTVTDALTGLGYAMPTAWTADGEKATGKVDGRAWTLTFDGQSLTAITITEEKAQ